MTSVVGLEVDRVAFDIERGKIAEFARATYAADAAHTDRAAAREAGFATVPATATHVAVAGHHRDPRAFAERLGMDMSRIVVGSVSWSYERPLLAGDSVVGIRTVLADEVREGRRGGSMRLVTLETVYRDSAGHRAVSVREVLIERSAV